MAHLNVKDRIIESKIVYFGAGLSGKTTNLEQIKRLSEGGRAGNLVSLDTDGDRTLFFDWLPVDIGQVNGCDVKLQLFTVPGQPQYAETRRKVLAGADGIVMVLDSQSGALDRNRDTVKDLHASLDAHGLSISDVAFVVQLNKRDVPTAMAPEALLDAVGLSGRPYLEAVAANGRGVFETLREVTRLVLGNLRDAAKGRRTDLRVGGTSSLDGQSLYRDLVGMELPNLDERTASSASAGRDGTARSGTSGSAAPRRVPIAPAPQPRGGVANKSVHDDGPGGPRCAALDGAPNTAQIGEMIGALRATSRRLDDLERSLARSVDASLRKIESVFGERTKDHVAAVEATFRSALHQDARDRDARAALSLLALEGSVAEITERLGALGGPGGRLAPLDDLAGRIPTIDETRQKLSTLDTIESRLGKLSGLETLPTQLGAIDDKLATFEPLVGGMSAVALRLDDIERRSGTILERIAAIEAALSRFDELRPQVGTIEKQLLALGAIEKKLDTLDTDRLNVPTLETRLGAAGKVIVAQVDGLVEQKLSRDRASILEATRVLTKTSAEQAQLASTRHDSVLGAIVQVEGRIGRLDARSEADGKRQDDLAGSLDALTDAVVEGLKGLDTRLTERLTSILRSVDATRREASDHTRGLGDRIAEIGVVARKLSDEVTQKKGWFR